MTAAARLRIATVIGTIAVSHAGLALAQIPCASHWGGAISISGTNPHGVAVGDWNSDGNRDIAAACGDGVRVVLGTGVTPLTSASFSSPTTVLVTGTPFAVLAAMVNEDAVVDLVTANYSNGTIGVLLGDGTGAFGPPIHFPSGANPFDVVAADFNGDGRLDIAVSNNTCSGGAMSILLAQPPIVPGQPRFAAPVAYPLGCNPALISTADFNEDGRPDLAVAVHSDGVIKVLLGLGDGTFSSLTLTSGPSVFEARAADFDQDGKDDLASASSSGIQVRWGQGDATFGAPVLLLAGTSGGIAVGDQDGDGDQDLACEVGGQLRLILQSSPRVFAVASEALPMPGVVAPRLVDLEGDGRADLVASQYAGNAIKVVPGACVIPPPPLPPAPDPAGPGWDAQGKPVGLGTASQSGAVVAPDGVGGLYVVWEENSKVRGQHFDASGLRLWNAGGIEICVSGLDQVAPAAIADGSGGLYVAWLQDPSGSRRVRLIRLTAAGFPSDGWPACGIQVSSNPHAFFIQAPALLLDSSGGVFVACLEQLSRSAAIAHHVTSAGAPAAGWPVGGAQYASGESGAGVNRVLTGTQIVSNGGGGLVAVTISTYSVTDPCCSSGASTAIARVSATGTTMVVGSVPANTVSLNPMSGGQSVVGYPAGDGVHERALASNGTLLWDVVVGPSASATLPQVSGDGAGGAFFVWNAMGSSASDLFGARLTSGGAPATGWASGATLLLSSPGTQAEARLAFDGAGGILLAWRDERSGDADIYFARRDGTGQAPPGWPADGTALVTIPGAQRRPLVTMASPISAIVVWEDLRSGVAQLYAQRVVLDQPVAALASLRSVSASASQVVVEWSVNDPPTSMRVERSAGDGAWANQGPAAVSGDGVVAWSDAQVTAGARLGYRLVDRATGSAIPGSEAWVDVPAALALSLKGFDPNPAVSGATLSFTLPISSPASLEVFDVAGRSAFAREVGTLGPGRHRVAVGDLAPGFYVVRLTQSGEMRIQRGVVVR